MNVVGPAVEENDRGTVARSQFGVSDVENAGVDLPERSECAHAWRLARCRGDKAQAGCGRPGNLKEAPSIRIGGSADGSCGHYTNAAIADGRCHSSCQALSSATKR